MPARVCEACGQPLPDRRLGVRMSPFKARLFDIVERAGLDGIASDDLFSVLFADRGVTRKSMRAHIWQINDALADTGYRIRWRGEYRLERIEEAGQ
jgi:hypothetical protein